MTKDKEILYVIFGLIFVGLIEVGMIYYSIKYWKYILLVLIIGFIIYKIKK